jgi:4-amino-4-deoxy-L-arabinose transferase-like glycosyltransferase
MGVSVLASAAIFAFAVAQDADADAVGGALVRRRRHWMLAGWAACALAVLSKGLIGIVLPAATVALYVLVRRDWALLLRLELARGTAVFSRHHGALVHRGVDAQSGIRHFFFVQEHFQRFTTTDAPPRAPGLVLHSGARRRRRAVPLHHRRRVVGRAAPPGPGFSPSLFLALWALVVFVFFSASSSKLPGYILPLVPALAVLGGAWVARAAPRRLLLGPVGCRRLFGVALAAAAPRLARMGLERLDPFAGGYSAALIAAGLLLAAGGVCAAVLARRGSLQASVVALSVGAFCAALAAIAGHRVYAPVFNASSTIAAMKHAPSPDAPFFAVHSYDHSVPWSLRRTVTMVGYRDEFGDAVHWEPGKAGKYMADDADSCARGARRAKPTRSSRCATSSGCGRGSRCRWSSPRAVPATSS